MSEQTTNAATRGRIADLMIGADAVLISAVSLGLAVSANHTQERLLAASTWPFLQYGTGNRTDEGESAITLSLYNGGIGPARIHTLQVLLDGKPQFDAANLLLACCNPQSKPVSTVTSAGAGVLAADADARFLMMSEKDNDPAVWAAFNRRRFDVRVLACYCSVLKECWTFDSLAQEPEPVAACPGVAEADRWHG